MGKDFEDLVSSVLSSIDPPFKTFIDKGYKHLTQIDLVRVGGTKHIIADDLLVIASKDEKGRDIFRAVINDSKLTAKSPWTPNQTSELINIFTNDKNLKYIEFEVRTNNSFLTGTPIQFKNKIRIYREDVFKTISDSNGSWKSSKKVF